MGRRRCTETAFVKESQTTFQRVMSRTVIHIIIEKKKERKCQCSHPQKTIKCYNVRCFYFFPLPIIQTSKCFLNQCFSPVNVEG